MTLNLTDLLSSKAKLLHTTRRAYFQKRIVEFQGGKFVLYRFPNRRKAKLFDKIISEALETGVILQRIAARPTGSWENFKYPNWLAFHYETGEQLDSTTKNESIFSSLGKSLAILHRQSSPVAYGLLHEPKIDLAGTYDELAASCTPEQKQWIQESQNRLKTIASFRLTHGDLYAKNILTNSDSDAILIDYELFSFDLPGIELGMLLLRHFCRTESKRRALLDDYLAHCDEVTNSHWKTHWEDFLVAAAVRLAAQRNLRQQIISRRHNRLSILSRIPLPQSIQAKISHHKNLHAQTIQSADKSRKQHLEQGKKLVSLICSQHITDPNTLISRCFKKGPAAKPLRPPNANISTI